jgi:DNA-binding NarL/FixJ family response regulator
MIITLMVILDVTSDIKHSVDWSHVLVELAMIFSAILVVILGAYWFYEVSEKSMTEIKETMNLSMSESKFLQEENRKLLQGVSQRIQEQFNAWKFTNAEIDIGFFLLKGFSFKEIAKLRDVTEKTVREHAGNIYYKAGIAGRAELSAYFLEDLLPTKSIEASARRS